MVKILDNFLGTWKYFEPWNIFAILTKKKRVHMLVCVAHAIELADDLSRQSSPGSIHKKSTPMHPKMTMGKLKSKNNEIIDQLKQFFVAIGWDEYCFKIESKCKFLQNCCYILLFCCYFLTGRLLFRSKDFLCYISRPVEC